MFSKITYSILLLVFLDIRCHAALVVNNTGSNQKPSTSVASRFYDLGDQGMGYPNGPNPGYGSPQGNYPGNFYPSYGNQNGNMQRPQQNFWNPNQSYQPPQNYPGNPGYNPYPGQNYDDGFNQNPNDERPLYPNGPGNGIRYPGNQDGYPGNQDGYPGNQNGYPGNQNGYPGNQNGYPDNASRYPPQNGQYPPQGNGQSNPGSVFDPSSVAQPNYKNPEFNVPGGNTESPIGPYQNQNPQNGFINQGNMNTNSNQNNGAYPPNSNPNVFTNNPGNNDGSIIFPNQISNQGNIARGNQVPGNVNGAPQTSPQSNGQNANDSSGVRGKPVFTPPVTLSPGQLTFDYGSGKYVPNGQS